MIRKDLDTNKVSFHGQFSPPSILRAIQLTNSTRLVFRYVTYQVYVTHFF